MIHHSGSLLQGVETSPNRCNLVPIEGFELRVETTPTPHNLVAVEGLDLLKNDCGMRINNIVFNAYNPQKRHCVLNNNPRRAV